LNIFFDLDGTLTDSGALREVGPIVTRAGGTR